MSSRPPLSSSLPTLAALSTALLVAACGGGAGSTASVNEAALAADVVPALTTDEAPPLGGTSAPEPAALQREGAAAAACAAPTYAHPKVSAWDMSRDTSAARQALLAKFDLAVVGVSPGALGPFAAAIKQINPQAQVAQYLNFIDLVPATSSSDESYALAQAVQSRGWWLKDAKGDAVSWTGGRTAGVNVTGWADPDPSGKRWPQFKAEYDARTYFAAAPGVDYLFAANTLVRPRAAADWRRAGSDQAASDAGVQSATRAAYAAYWNALRAAVPSLKVMAGADNDLSTPEYKGAADAAFLDGMIGQTWSLESWAGWDTMMGHYRAGLADVKPGRAGIFVAYGSSPVDYASMRYGLASALLDEGHFMFRPLSGSQVPALYDEYLAPLGKALDAAPTAPKSNGIWLRRFENGLVLVNPQKTEATIDVGPGYRRLAGTQDPAVNNGQAQQSVTLGARQGLVMLKVPAPCTDAAALARPPVAALDYSMDTSAARQALLARFDYVILGLSKSLGATTINGFVGGIKKLNPAAQVGQYSILGEMKCNAVSSDDVYPLWQAANQNGWWLRNAAGQRTQWTTSYGACDMNVSAWAPRNAAGQTWAQAKWAFDRSTLFSLAPFDFMFSDNTFAKTRVSADWQRNGVDMPKGDATASAALRAGHAAYWSAIRATDPSLKIIGNADSDLASPEYKGNIDGAFLESVIGKSWSVETWAGWDQMMAYYRGALRNAREPGLVFLNASAAVNDYATLRYALASTMLENGKFVFVPGTGTMQPSWYDEYDAPIGAPAEAPPTAAAQNGIWMRRYANGLVLVNPSKTSSASIDVGPGYKRLAGQQDPAVNNGQAAQVVTLGPRQGLLLVRQ